jgi:pimeloyl-ACP methyl ester carboxylesterase
MAIEPFRIDLPQETLDELRQRLTATRWPDAVEGVGWEQGMPPGALREPCEHWRDGFDWRAREAALNRFDHIRATVGGVGLHAVRTRAEGGTAGALVLTDGWPSCFVELLRIVPLLTRAGDDGPGFDVVVPSLPGFGFSDRPQQAGMNLSRVADLWAGLMGELGYERFGAHGSDLGAGVVSQLKARHPQRLTGAHSSSVYWEYPYDEADLRPEERDFHARGQQWSMAEGAYAHQQGTKPQTLSYGLTDSPAGLAGWVLEKWHAWSDGGLGAFDHFPGLEAPEVLAEDLRAFFRGRA